MPKTIDNIIPDEDICLNYLEKLRWNGIVVSPFVSTSKVYYCSNGKYKCRDSGKYFNVRTNTIFHNSRIKLRVWFLAIKLLSESKKITSIELARKLNTTQKTAWFIMRRIKRTLDLDQLVAKEFLNENYISEINVVAEFERLNIVDWLKRTKS